MEFVCKILENVSSRIYPVSFIGNLTKTEFFWVRYHKSPINSFMTLCSANQRSGFYMITASVMKELRIRMESNQRKLCESLTV